MRRASGIVGVLACLSLVGPQLAGLHWHADDRGFVGGPTTSFSHAHGHAHDHDAPGHLSDYHDAEDVSSLDIAPSPLKLTLALLALLFAFSVLPRAGTLLGTEFAYPVLSGRHTRWRPPLRAPPAPDSI